MGSARYAVERRTTATLIARVQGSCIPALSILAASTGFLLGLAGCDRPGTTPSSGSQTILQFSAPVPKGTPLVAGGTLPSLKVEGWLNGPPVLEGPGVRLVVVDVWANWCPYCRYSAPEMVRIYRKFADQGVKFVSLTNMNRETAEKFGTEFAVPWANGYGAHPDTLNALGVNSGMLMTEYQIAPTVYLVGHNGLILWSDKQGRYRHTDSKEWGQQLDEAIAAALSEAEKSKGVEKR